MRVLVVLGVFVISNLAFAQNSTGNRSHICEALSDSGLFNDRTVENNLKMEVYSYFKNNSNNLGKEGLFLIERNGTGRATFLDLFFNSDGKHSMAMSANCSFDKNGLIVIGEHVGPLDEINSLVQRLLRTKSACYLVNESTTASVSLKPVKSNVLSKRQAKIIQCIYTNYSTYPIWRQAVDEAKYQVYGQSMTVINSSGQKVSAVVLLSIYVLPEGVKGNGGVLVALPSSANGKYSSTPILFSAINTTDKTNKICKVFEDQDNQKIGSLKELERVLKILEETNPTEVLVSRKVDNQIEIKDCN